MPNCLFLDEIFLHANIWGYFDIKNNVIQIPINLI